MALDIRQAISEVLQQYGHDIVYIERDLRFRCTCYSERSGESANPNCPKCFGTSYHVNIKKARVRRTIASVPETLIGLNKLMEEGNAVPKAYTYYFEYHVHPKEGDLILEVDWINGLPKRIKEKHFISVAEPKFGESGRIEFYQVYCRYRPKGASDDDALSAY
jgi:hypothetical protein